MAIVKTLDALKDALTEENWRGWPMQYDIPASCQIFGEMVKKGGIEGILYNSKFTDKPCLAVFPSNLLNSTSYIQIDDPVPTDGGTLSRLDRTTIKQLS